KLLRDLVLMLRVGDFLDLLGQTVEVDADVPVDLPVTADRFQGHRSEVPVGRDSNAEGIVPGKAHAVRIRRVEMTGLRILEAPENARAPGEQQISTGSVDVS